MRKTLKWAFRLLLLLAVIVCAPTIMSMLGKKPELAQGIERSVIDADTAFKERVQKAIALGSDVQTVRQELAKQGFKVTDNHANHIEVEFLCNKQWSISWKTEKDVITSVNAKYGLTCP